jgi:4-hydroxybenzoate polyprenyltransferase
LSADGQPVVAAPAGGRSVPRALLVEMRPRQWTKNLIVLAPVLFSLELDELRDVVRALAAVLIFCLISSGTYLVNDLHDLRRDRLHEVRRRRPLAAGQLDPRTAAVAAAVLLGTGLAGSLLLGTGFALTACGFVVLQVAYTFYLKHEVILDVMAISAGFVLRVTAGAAAVHVTVSPWLLSCAALLALFLAFIKRRHELLADPHALEHRPVLRKYTPALLDQAIAIVTASTFVVYAIYTFQSQSATQRPYLMLTIPFVAYGLFRYLYLMHARHLGGSPEEVLLSDVPLAVDLLLWTVVVVIVLYFT